MGKPERKVEDHLIETVQSYGGECLKFISPGNNGVPDEIVMLNNQVVMVEVKSAHGRTETHQRNMHRRLRKQGLAVYVVDAQEQVDMLVDMILRGEIVSPKSKEDR